LLLHLRVLADRQDAEIIVLEAVSFIETLFEMPNALSPDQFGGGGDTAFAQKYVSAVCELLHSQGLKARSLVQIGSPAATVASVARRQGATLIALAIRERAGFPQTLVHTLAEKVLRASPTPVYAVPAVTTEDGVDPPAPSGEIVIPVDGSGLSLQSIPAAAAFCRRLGGHLLFLHVLSPGSDASSVERVFRNALRESEREGIPAETLFRRGNPSSEILKVCEERQVSMIAMRTRLRAKESSGLIGSITLQILRSARVPMLIVRRPVPPAATAAVTTGSGAGTSREMR